jgi:hypothetical protein
MAGGQQQGAGAGQPVRVPAETTEDDERFADLERARSVMEKAGYQRVKQGAVNCVGYDRIETWLKRGSQVYLAHNSATGDWGFLQEMFARDDGGPIALGDHLKQMAG